MYITKDVWNKTFTLNWTNPLDADFNHVRIDRTSPTETITLINSEVSTSYADTTASYAVEYTYTLYTVDTAGNVSAGIITSNQKLKNPAPTNLVLTPGDHSIAATWNASSAPVNTVGGYKVKYGMTRNNLNNVIDVGNITSANITGLVNGRRYYVAVTAYSRAGIESQASSTKSAIPAS